MFCVKCKGETDTVDIVHTVSRNSRNMLKGKCVQCGRVKCQLVKTSTEFGTAKARGGDLVGTLNRITSNIWLPFQKFEGEMRVPEMNLIRG